MIRARGVSVQDQVAEDVFELPRLRSVEALGERNLFKTVRRSDLRKGPLMALAARTHIPVYTYIDIYSPHIPPAYMPICLQVVPYNAALSFCPPIMPLVLYAPQC